MNGGIAGMATRSGAAREPEPDGRGGVPGRRGRAQHTGPRPASRRIRSLTFGRANPWSLHQIGLAALSCLGVAILLTALAQVSIVATPWWLLVLVPAVTMRFSGTTLPLVLGLTLLSTWAVHVPVGSFSWWSTPAAVGLLVWHAATSLSAALPQGASPDRSLLWRWAVRAAAVALAAPAAAGLVALVPVATSGTAALAAFAALLGLAAIVWLARTEPVSEPE